MNESRAEVKLRPTRGVKREADDTLDDDHRFAKRFNLLNLDHTGKLYIPVEPRPQQRAPPQPQPPVAQRNVGQDDHMQLDDTKHRVYVHDLDDELADVESDEEKLIFLPDIEKRLNSIPKHVLTGLGPAERDPQQELVLYSVPTSLTVPAEYDSVRKAILEARQRAREKTAHEAELAAKKRNVLHENAPETAHGFSAEEYIEEEPDADAMDIG